MRVLRSVLVFFVLLAVAGAQPADAQFRNLRKKLQKKAKQKVERTVEQRVEARLDRAMDDAINKSVDSIADDLEGSIEGLLLSNEPSDVEVGDNEAGDPDAAFVSYTQVSRIRMLGGGMAEKLLNRYGATKETTSTHGAYQRVDREKTSQVMDAEHRRIIEINREDKTYWITELADLLAPVEEIAEADMPAPSPEMEGATGSIKDLKVTVDRRDEIRTIHGVEARRTVAVVEGEYEMSGTDRETGEQMTVQGKSYTVLDQWHSTTVAGYKTIVEFQRRMAEAFMSAMGENSFGGFIDAMKSSPAMQQSAAQGFKDLGEIEGLPIRSSVHFVQVPPDGRFDLDAVLSDNPGGAQTPEPGAQRTVMTLVTDIGDLTTTPLDLSLFGVPGGDYTQIDSPMEEALRRVQEEK